MERSIPRHHVPVMVALLVAAGCFGGDDKRGTDGGSFEPDAAADSGTDSGGPEGEWALVHEGLDSALMSVAGTSSSDVWTVGADSGDGMGALALHFDGSEWTRVPTHVEEHLWWVHVFEGGPVLVGGTNGTILRDTTGSSGFHAMITPGPKATVYGIWGTEPTDVWAVGGDPEVTPGFVWRFDGRAWRDVTDELPAEVPPLFKVWGRAADDVWIVATDAGQDEDGVAVHWDGDAFSLVRPATDRPLFTVHGAPSGQPRNVAVGGFASATIVEYDGSTWTDVTPEGAVPQMFGVFMTGDEAGYAVGLDGAVAMRDADGWALVDTGFEVFFPFHAVWVDPDGGVWAAGGDVLTPFMDQGMLAHFGAEVPNDIVD